MNRFLLVIFLLVLFFSCKPPVYTYRYKTIPAEIEIMDTSKAVLLVNAEVLPDNPNADLVQTSIDSKAYSKNEVVVDNVSSEIVNVAKSNYLQYLSNDLQEGLKMNVLIAKQLDKNEMELLLSKNPGVANKLMRKYDAGLIIVIKSEEGGFKLNKIDKIKYTDTRKQSKTALYDVFYDTKALIIQDDNFLDRDIYVSKYHSERTVSRDMPMKLPKPSRNKADINTISKDNSKKLSQLFMEKNVVETFMDNKRFYSEVQ